LLLCLFLSRKVAQDLPNSPPVKYSPETFLPVSHI